MNNLQPSHVFISYAHNDYLSFVTHFIQDLQAAGISIWIDQQGLTVGTPDWQQAIRAAIRNAYALIYVASEDAAISRYVHSELHIAEMYQKPIFPIWATGERWGECTPFELTSAHYADARGVNYHIGTSQVIDALHSLRYVPTKQDIAAKTLEVNFIPRNPYKGLRAFLGEDRGDFFGRERLVNELIEALRSQEGGPRFLALVGPSGSGKSSIIRAGLLPHLQNGALPNSGTWIYLDPILPSPEPVEALANTLADQLKIGTGAVEDDLNRSVRGMHKLIARIAKHREERVVLFVDQFEELFAPTINADTRSHFIDLLVFAVTEKYSQAIVIITLRADFYDRPMNYPELGKTLETHAKSVLKMEVDELRAAIEKPVSLPDVKLDFEEGLVGDILFEIRDEPGALPLLQFTLEKLVQHRKGRMLTRLSYEDIGGVRGALTEHAEATYNMLPSDEHKEMARAMFLRLIELGETEQDTTRRRARLSELLTPDLYDFRACETPKAVKLRDTFPI